MKKHARGKEPACQCRRHKRPRFDPWVGKIPWRRAWQPPPVLPGDSHAQRSLECYSPWGHKESNMTEVTWHKEKQQWYPEVASNTAITTHPYWKEQGEGEVAGTQKRGIQAGGINVLTSCSLSFQSPARLSTDWNQQEVQRPTVHTNQPLVKRAEGRAESVSGEASWWYPAVRNICNTREVIIWYQ